MDNDTEYVDAILEIVRNHYQACYTGYDTYIDRSNVLEHLFDLTKEAANINEKLNAVADLLQEYV